MRPDTDLSARLRAHIGVGDPMAIHQLGATGHLGVAEFAALAPRVAAPAVDRSVLRNAVRALRRGAPQAVLFPPLVGGVLRRLDASVEIWRTPR